MQHTECNAADIGCVFDKLSDSYVSAISLGQAVEFLLYKTGLKTRSKHAAESAFVAINMMIC